MHIQVIDNVNHKLGSLLISAIEAANDVRIAVAFVSNDGISEIMPAVNRIQTSGASIEFLIGMDARLTDPRAVQSLFNLCSSTPQASLLCFTPRNPSALYHPKMYLTRNLQIATAIIGSSNLTHRGLTSNIEANLVIEDHPQAEIISEIYATYNRLKYHPDRVIPDQEFIDIFSDLHQRERIQERKLTKDPALKRLRQTFLEKSGELQRPKPSRADLIGWLEMVYDSLPDENFSNQDIYAYEAVFRQRYPQNLNIRAKIRQQLQILRDLGFIEHISRGVWRKVV